LRAILLLILLALTAIAHCEYEYHYFEGEGYTATQGSGLREEGFTSWMRHPSGSKVMVLNPEGWLEYEVRGLGEGPYEVFVRGLAWAAGCEVDVYWDGEKVGRPRYTPPGTALKWSAGAGQVKGPGDHKLRIVADRGITQAPYIDTILLTNQQGYRPSDEDADFASFTTPWPLLCLDPEGKPVTIQPDPGGSAAPDADLDILGVELQPLGLGENRGRVLLRNTGRPLSLTVEATLGNAEPTRQSADLATDAQARCDLSCDALVAGPLPLKLRLLAGDRPLVTGSYRVTIADPVAVSLDRFAYKTGTEQALWKAAFTAKPDVVEELAIRAILQTEGGEKLQAHETMGAGTEVEHGFGISGLPEGRYRVSTTVERRGTTVLGETRALDIYTPEPLETWEPVRKSEVRGDTLYLNDRPFLGKLLYHAAANAATREHGFNLVQCYGSDPNPVESIGRHLDACAETGIWGAVALFNNTYLCPGDHFDLEHLREVILRYKDHPALWGWDLIDEPEVTMSPEKVAEGARLIRELDPNHIVWVNLCQPPRAQDYLESQDLWSFDFYPVPGLPVFSYMGWIGLSDAHFRGKRPIGSVMQTFTYPGARMPTPDELRSMTYLHIIHGYKWLGFYSYYDGEPSGCLARDPVLWSATEGLTSQLRALGDVILGPEPYVPVQSSAGAEVFQAAIKQHDGRTYLFAVSGSADAVSVEMTLPGVQADTLFENGRSVAIVDGKLKDDFRPHGVHVYVVR